VTNRLSQGRALCSDKAVNLYSEGSGFEFQPGQRSSLRFFMHSPSLRGSNEYLDSTNAVSLQIPSDSLIVLPLSDPDYYISLSHRQMNFDVHI
jgi:hypothetical protein